MDGQTKKSSDIGRLGKCEVCNFNLAKYTCPKCEVKTCQIDCLRIHKIELNCDGIRDITKYIPFKQITEADLMNDYVFIESCTNYTSTRRTDKIKRYTVCNRSLPIPHMKLKKAAAGAERKIKLDFLPPNFDKHKANKTYYDWVSKVIFWCIEWRFINANNKIIIDVRCCESNTMHELIGKYFDNGDSSLNSLGCYRSNGLDRTTLLLKAEGMRKSKNRFFVMDLKQTLLENLKGKTIVEFPVIYVVYNSELSTYDIIGNEETVTEETRKHKNHYFPTMKKNNVKTDGSIKNNNDMNSVENTYHSQRPINFLFSSETQATDDENDSSDEFCS